MLTIKPPFNSAEKEAEFIDIQIQDWRRRIEALQEGDSQSTTIKNHLASLISDGMKAAATLRAFSYRLKAGWSIKDAVTTPPTL